MGQTFSDQMQGLIDGRTRAPNVMWLLAMFVFSAIALELQVLSAGLNMGILLFLSLTGILLAHMVLQGGGLAPLKIHDYAYIAYVLFTIISVTWSVAPGKTLVGAIPQFALLIVSLWLFRMPEKFVLRMILVFALVAAILSLLLVPVAGSVAFQPRSSTGAAELRGVFKHQLRLGAFMATMVGLFVLMYMNQKVTSYFFKSPLVNTLAFLTLVLVLLLSRTRLYVATAVLALIVTILISKKGGGKWFSVAAMFVGVTILAALFNQILTYLEFIGFDTGLSGRTLIWLRVQEGMEHGPTWLGYGYRTLETSYFDYLFRGRYRPPHAHNSYIQAYFETGRIGQALVYLVAATQFFAAWKTSVDNNKYSYSLFLVLYVIFGSLFGLNYAGAISTNVCLMFLFLSVETRQRERVAMGYSP